jgi:hypothetical protein
LALHRALPLSYGPMFWLLASCLSCDAREDLPATTIAAAQPNAR